MANPYFNAIYYFSQNPDLAVAGLKVEDAYTHYVNYGAAEALLGATSRAPNAWFDIKHYYSTNPDLVAAINAGQLTVAGLFEHFTNYGAAELRSPASGITLTDASLSAYAAANQDLVDAFKIADPAKLTAEEKAALVSQFYAHGINETRPAKPAELPNNGQTGSTFTLTTGTDVADTAGSIRVIGGAALPDTGFKFTSGNETVEASTATLTAGDSLLDGSITDSDVLNVSVTGATNLQTVRNIETINLATTGATAASTITGLSVSGLKTINISGTASGNITLADFGPGASHIADTGVTTIDASKLSTNVGIVIDSSQAVSSASLTVKGAAGADTVILGRGNDNIDGGAGADRLDGGAGDDIISGGGGADVLLGGNGNDTLNGDAGNDVLFGGAGNDTLNGGAGDDFIITGAGNNTVSGGAGNDTIYLGTSATVLTNATWNVATNLAPGTNAFAAVAGANNTVILEASRGENGADTISGFTGGAVNAGNGGDVLNISAFLGKAVTNFAKISGTDGSQDNVADSNLVVVTNTTLAAAQAEVGGTGVVLGNNAKIAVLEVDGTTNTLANLRYVTTDANGTVVGNDVVVTLVGQPAADLSGFLAANFA